MWSSQESDESDSGSAQTEMMGHHPSRPAELEEEAAAEADVTVSCNSPKPKQTHLCLMMVVTQPFGERDGVCAAACNYLQE